MLTETEKQEWRNQIDGMSQMQMARLHRFAPSGHPVFNTTNGLHEYFEARFKKLGGFTPAVSKAGDWLGRLIAARDSREPR